MRLVKGNPEVAYQLRRREGETYVCDLETVAKFAKLRPVKNIQLPLLLLFHCMLARPRPPFAIRPTYNQMILQHATFNNCGRGFLPNGGCWGKFEIDGGEKCLISPFWLLEIFLPSGSLEEHHWLNGKGQ